MRVLFIIFSLLMCSAGANAQKLHLGIKAGANFNNIDEVETFYQSTNVGYHAGLFAEIGLGKINLQPEVYFSSVKVDKEENAQTFVPLPDINLRYLNIPVLFNFKVLPVLSLQAGPHFGIMIDKNESPVQNGEDAFKRGDFGIAAGAQVNLTKLKLYARYIAGLSDVSNGGGNWKNRQVHVGAGFRLF